MDNSRVNQEDWLAERLIERLYHEDSLFAQRTSHFIATHAFLAAALALSLPGSRGTILEGFQYLVALFGLLLSLFYIPLGRRSYIAIQFWRVWLHGLESELGFKFDSALGEFYEDGYTETSVGKIDSQRSRSEITSNFSPRKGGPNSEVVLEQLQRDSHDREMKSMMEVFPWKYVASTNLWLGVWLPALIAVFWAIALVLIVPPALCSRIRLGVAVLLFVLMIAVLGYVLSWQPAVPTPPNRQGKRINDGS